MVKNYKGINDDLLVVLQLAQDRSVQKIRDIKTSRYPQELQKQYDLEMEAISRLAKAIKK